MRDHVAVQLTACDTIKRRHSAQLAFLRRVCLLTIDLSKMQDPSGWYSRQRSNAGHHLYPIQETTSPSSVPTPDTVHGAPTLPGMYRDPFTSATSTTHGEISSLSQPYF